MCGNATFTIVVSSTWISVADITASVIIRRSAPVGSSCAGCGAAAEATALLFVRRHRHEDRAGDAPEQRLLVALGPPAREAPALLVAEHDEVRLHELGGARDALDGVAVLERAAGVHAALAQPLHALV